MLVMIKKITFLFFFIFKITSIFAQSSEREIYSDIDDALSNALKVKEYYLDCSTENDSLFFALINKFPNLNKITIAGYQKGNFPTSFFNSKKIETIVFIECLDLKYQSLFKSLKIFPDLKNLTFDLSDINIIPAEIGSLPKLTSLTLTNCESLNLEKSIPSLALASNLRYLALPVNQLSALPINIGLLKQVEVLDISNNYLYDIPDEASKMQNLQKISTQGNIFIKPVQSFEKIKGLNIKYLAASSSLTEEEKTLLKNLFPNSIIEFKDADEISQMEIETKDTTGTDDVKYGTFQIDKQNFRILSESYINYPKEFRNELFRSPFDSLLFDERYSDTTYSNINKVRTNSIRVSLPQYNIFYLNMFKKPKNLGLDKKSIVFTFDYTFTRLRYYNPEMAAFFGMAWVYKGPLNKRAFRKKFIKNHSKQQWWSDVRIDFDNSNNIFTVELKNSKGFEAFPAYLSSINQGIDNSFQRYGKQYLRYTKSLESRRKRFNKSLIRKRADYQKTKLVSSQERWDSFVKNYFSSEEKKMSKEQWFEYYNYVVGHEEELLYQSGFTKNCFNRLLILKNYLSSNGFGQNFLFDSAGVSQNIIFTNEQDNALPVKDVYVLNTKNKIYYNVDGSLGVDPNILFLRRSESIAIIIILVNGNIGVLTPKEYADKVFPFMENIRIKVQLFNRKLATIGQIFEFAGL